MGSLLGMWHGPRRGSAVLPGRSVRGQHLVKFLQPMQESEVQGGGRGGIDGKALVALQLYGGGDTLTSGKCGQQITSGCATQPLLWWPLCCCAARVPAREQGQVQPNAGLCMVMNVMVRWPLMTGACLFAGPKHACEVKQDGTCRSSVLTPLRHTKPWRRNKLVTAETVCWCCSSPAMLRACGPSGKSQDSHQYLKHL